MTETLHAYWSNAVLFFQGHPAALILLKIAAVLGVILGMVSYTVFAERRISALIQDRVGPNRVGPAGLLQPIADSFKLLLKENVMPGHVNKVYYVLAPTLAIIPALLTFIVIPFGNTLAGEPMVIADLNVGVLWMFSIASLGVYGIVLGGWASNSKYPFFGGIRSSAQMISYEIAMGLSLVPVFMHAESLNLNDIVRAQEGWWFFAYPDLLLALVIFLVASFAETNRLPFDFPESEQELVGGYNTEYGSMKFAFFFLAEYANLITASALLATLFFGGWQIPQFILKIGPVSEFLTRDVRILDPLVFQPIGLAYILCFFAKTVLVLGFFVWIRWVLPRFRYDQLMNLGWKVFLPLALFNVFATGTWFALTRN